MQSVDHRALSSPINKATAIVISGGEGFYKNNMPLHYRRWKIPPETVKPRVNEPSVEGVRFGRFVVVGRLPKQSKHNGAPYLVKCSCGWYETRLLKAIRNPLNNEDCCIDCQLIIHRNRQQQLQRKLAILDEIAEKKARGEA